MIQGIFKKKVITVVKSGITIGAFILRILQCIESYRI